MPNLIRLASAAAAAACIVVAVPAAASAEPAQQAAPAASRCSSGVLIGFLRGNHINGGGWLTCFRPDPSAFRTVDATLYRNRLPVAYGRTDCMGFNGGCSVHSPSVPNLRGIQTWCVISTTRYSNVYRSSRRECWRG